MPSYRITQAMTDAFQSAPAIAGGRCQRADAFERADDGFNPRPPLLAGDARARPPGRGAARRFNPRPPLLAGDAAGRCPGGRRTCRFNPRPPLLAGDARGSCCQSPCHPRFNPRPPLLAGDAHVVDAGLVVFVVSIRARHCWRAMPPLPPSPPLPAMFQSAPAIAGGRCPRARRRLPSSKPFQSAPAIAGGRCGSALVDLPQPGGFNPRPPLLAGDARGPGRGAHDAGVSIRARHCWRAMPPPRSSPAWFHGFNPRPPLLAGDAAAARLAHDLQEVSIRARHCWRAMRASTATFLRKSSFNPRPPLLAGDAPSRWRMPKARTCFNPRPPLLAGDASCPALIRHKPTVSIRARHCWRAMPQRHLGDRVAVLVSIRARHCWRAMRGGAGGYTGKGGFQSAPAIAGGRCLPPDSWVAAALSFNPRPPLLAGDAFHLRNLAQAHDVSIRARHCWRAMLPCTTQRAHSAGFQSAPAIAGGRCMPGACATPWHKCFNPRPPLLAGDACSRRSTPRPIWCFNPRPPLLAGDASRPAPTTRAARSFNPRPPLLAGDA